MEGTSPLGIELDNTRLKFVAVGAVVGLIVFGALAFLAVRIIASGWDMPTALAVATNGGVWGGISFGLIGGNAAYELKYGEHAEELEEEHYVVGSGGASA
ncbi:MAG: hypothetical protein KDB21_20310 [Acidimicrobiales bacterium]|nr:hypothetical protein [Acidimicrobiales bacterium]